MDLEDFKVGYLYEFMTFKDLVNRWRKKLSLNAIVRIANGKNLKCYYIERTIDDEISKNKINDNSNVNMFPIQHEISIDEKEKKLFLKNKSKYFDNIY